MFSLSRSQLLIISLAILGFSLFSLSCKGSKASTNKNETAAEGPVAIEVSTAPAIMRELPRFFEATGALVADEQTDVAPSIAGKVVAVGVDLGTFVKRGQMLVRLDDVDLRLRLDQAKAQLEQAKASLRQAEEKIGLRPGQTAFDPNKVPDVLNAKVALDLAEKNLDRARKLVESGDIPQSQFDQQLAQRDQLKQLYESSLALARQNHAAMMTAKATVVNAESQVGLAERSLSYAIVFSPIDGFVAERNANVGEYVSPTAKVATVVKINPLRMRIDIPEQAIPQIKTGQSVSITTSAWPDTSFSGRIVRIAPSVLPNSRTLTVEAEIENPSGALKPGQFATVRILQSETQPAVLIPSRAVSTESGVSRVFVIKDGIAQQRLVQLGQTEADLVEIRSGVAGDEYVATSNVDKLSDGVAVIQ